MKGVLIAPSQRRLAHILAMPNRGICYLKLENKADGLKCILERDDITDLDILLANQLFIEMRLLHHIVSRILYPKTSRFDWIAKKEIAIIYYMIQGQPMNLPFMMLQQIQEAAGRSSSCLSYSMVFTFIFLDFEVSLKGEDYKEMLPLTIT